VDLLAELNESPGWRALYGPRSPRVRDHELVLRILALYVRSGEYYRPLKAFLNVFLGDHRDLRKLQVPALRRLFEEATESLVAADARTYLRRSGQRVNAALLEAVVVAAMRRVAGGRDMSPAPVGSALEVLVADKRLSAAISGSTATEDNLRTRLELATAAFAID
jgi:hypothetical protein